MYSFNFNGNKIDLPKCTRGLIQGKIDITKKALSQAKGEYDYLQLVDEMYDFVREIIGEEKLKELIPHTDTDDIDVKDLEILFIEIGRTYDKKIDDYQGKINKSKLKDIVDAIPTKEIEKINSFAQHMGK